MGFERKRKFRLARVLLIRLWGNSKCMHHMYVCCPWLDLFVFFGSVCLLVCCGLRLVARLLVVIFHVRYVEQIAVCHESTMNYSPLECSECHHDVYWLTAKKAEHNNKQTSTHTWQHFCKEETKKDEKKKEHKQQQQIHSAIRKMPNNTDPCVAQQKSARACSLKCTWYTSAVSWTVGYGRSFESWKACLSTDCSLPADLVPTSSQPRKGWGRASEG